MQSFIEYLLFTLGWAIVAIVVGMASISLVKAIKLFLRTRRKDTAPVVPELLAFTLLCKYKNVPSSHFYVQVRAQNQLEAEHTYYQEFPHHTIVTSWEEFDFDH